MVPIKFYTALFFTLQQKWRSSKRLQCTISGIQLGTPVCTSQEIQPCFNSRPRCLHAAHSASKSLGCLTAADTKVAPTGLRFATPQEADFHFWQHETWTSWFTAARSTVVTQVFHDGHRLTSTANTAQHYVCPTALRTPTFYLQNLFYMSTVALKWPAIFLQLTLQYRAR